MMVAETALPEGCAYIMNASAVIAAKKVSHMNVHQWRGEYEEQRPEISLGGPAPEHVCKAVVQQTLRRHNIPGKSYARKW